MWFGVLWPDEDERQEQGEKDLAFLLAYQPDRVFRMAGPVGGMAHAAVTMRQAAVQTGERLDPPRCPHCAVDLEVPVIDDPQEQPCGSS
jgi:hypothetical protein